MIYDIWNQLHGGDAKIAGNEVISHSSTIWKQRLLTKPEVLGIHRLVVLLLKSNDNDDLSNSLKLIEILYTDNKLTQLSRNRSNIFNGISYYYFVPCTLRGCFLARNISTIAGWKVFRKDNLLLCKKQGAH